MRGIGNPSLQWGSFLFLGVASSFLASAIEIHRAGALSTKMAAAAGEPLKEQVKRGVDELPGDQAWVVWDGEQRKALVRAVSRLPN